jgi:hypothetical protein
VSEVRYRESGISARSGVGGLSDGGGIASRMGKMTINDDFLTTNDDFRRWSLPGRNGFSKAVLFDINGLSIVAATKCRIVNCPMKSMG